MNIIFGSFSSCSITIEEPHSIEGKKCDRSSADSCCVVPYKQQHNTQLCSLSYSIITNLSNIGKYNVYHGNKYCIPIISV